MTGQKPKLADAVEDFGNRDNYNRALGFIDFLESRKINTQWTNSNADLHTWKAVKKGTTVCYIKTSSENEGSLSIMPHYHNDYIGFPEKSANLVPGTLITVNPKSGKYDEIISDEKLMDMICSKISKCTDCGNKKKCAPGININWWGKELNNRCKFINSPFVNPDYAELECLKTLIDIFVDKL